MFKELKVTGLKRSKGKYSTTFKQTINKEILEINKTEPNENFSQKVQ